ncbi:MAG: (2Fe-2S)-binding protein [Ruminococcus sp.]|nr:(2Fe-2S)-binding protein [Ruminococcus sp.]
MNEIRFTLNGKETAYAGSAADRLLEVLRDTYDLKSVKCGCKEGECGACAVLIDGVLINSCCVAMGAVDSHEIMTVEGFRETEQFAALSKAFADLSAVQCGFCIPGMILAAQSVLSKNAHPTEEEIREGLSGNICRCTGYNAIVNAIMNAAKEGDGLW